MTPHHQQLYATHIAGMRRAIPRAQKMAAPVDDVAKAVERALSSKRPKARYVAGTGARAASVLARFGPTPMRDLVLGAASGVPRKID